LFLGAGFSKWSADLPVATELFDFAIEPWGPVEVRKLVRVKALKTEWDAAHPGGQAEQFIAAALHFTVKNKEAVMWYITRRLSGPFVWREFHARCWRRHILMVDENRRHQIEGVLRAMEFVQRFAKPGLMGIVTTNYDLLPEYSLGTKGFNYGIRNEVLTGRGAYPVSQWKNPVKLTGPVPIAKLHGSISWDEHDRYTDGRRGLTGRALIVAPVPEKTPPDLLQPVWELGEHILNRSRQLVVFGFAFNPYDEAVLNLLRTASRSVNSVLVIDRTPQQARAQSIWPKAQIHCCQPEPDGHSDIQTWLAAGCNTRN